MVRAALCARGSLKDFTPFEMHSTPVRAVVPLEKARNSRKRVNGSAWRVSIGGGSITMPSVPLRYRTKPAPTARTVQARKKYVGAAKVFPDSFTPRKLATAIKT